MDAEEGGGEVKKKSATPKKLYVCAECGEKKPAKEFPENWKNGHWDRSTCWDCLESDPDGYAVQLS